MRVGGKRLDVARLRLVDVTDNAFPRALDTAGIHVDLDEAVDGVYRRLLIADPGDVVGNSIGVLARFVELDQRAERFAHRRRRKRQRGAQMTDDPPDLPVVTAANPVDLLDQPAVIRRQARVQARTVR